MPIKIFLVNVIITSKSPVATPALLLTDETSATSINLAKKTPKWSSVIYRGTLCKVSFVFLGTIYSICNLTDFVVRRVSTGDFAMS